MKKLCNLLIVFLCFAFLCPALSESADPVVVRAGKVEYPLSKAPLWSRTGKPTKTIFPGTNGKS